MALIEQQNDRLIVRGAMTVETVASLMTEGVALLSGTVVVDLSAVEEVDSSAISLMFEWVRQGRERNAEVSYLHLPATLLSLATLYGVLDMIPQRTAAAH